MAAKKKKRALTGAQRTSTAKTMLKRFRASMVKEFGVTKTRRAFALARERMRLYEKSFDDESAQAKWQKADAAGEKLVGPAIWDKFLGVVEVVQKTLKTRGAAAKSSSLAEHSGHRRAKRGAKRKVSSKQKVAWTKFMERTKSSATRAAITRAVGSKKILPFNDVAFDSSHAAEQEARREGAANAAAKTAVATKGDPWPRVHALINASSVRAHYPSIFEAGHGFHHGVHGGVFELKMRDNGWWYERRVGKMLAAERAAWDAAHRSSYVD